MTASCKLKIDNIRFQFVLDVCMYVIEEYTTLIQNDYLNKTWFYLKKNETLEIY